MRVTHIGPLPEHGVGFVKEEDGVGILSFIEHAAEIFFGLSNVLGNQACQVDFVHIKTQLVCNDSRRHGLACSRWTSEQSAHTASQSDLLSQAPVVVYNMLVKHLRGQLLYLEESILRQYDVVPAESGFDLLGKGS